MPVLAGMLVVGAGAYLAGVGTSFWIESGLEETGREIGNTKRTLVTLAAAGGAAYLTYKVVAE